MKTVSAEQFVVYECGVCNHIMFFSKHTNLLRVTCPMCSAQFKLQSVNEVEIIEG
jgi:uncharacterized CHY-type Zn-finger protein